MSENEWLEWAAKQFEPVTPKWDTPGQLAQALVPGTRQTPALELIDAALVEAFNTPDSRLIISVSPQEGKSERSSKWFPLWALTQKPDTRIIIASYESSVARRWGRATRDLVLQYGDELGLKVRQDLAAQGEWQLAGHLGGVYTAGVGGAVTGKSAEILIIDDPVKDREQADSPTYQQRVWDWWTDTAKTRLAPGSSVVLIMTRWNTEDLAGKLLSAGDTEWKQVTIPAQCVDPDNDPLGRSLGEFMLSSRGRTQEQWEQIKATSPARTWSALYQQSPVPAEGAIWVDSWIDNNRVLSGEVMRPFDRVIVSVDPAAKSKKSSDYTGIVVAALKGDQAYVLDDKTMRGTPKDWAFVVWGACLEYDATDVLVEDNQGGEMVVEVLRSAWPEFIRNRKLNFIPPKITTVTARQSKRVRAEAAAAYYELNRVHHVSDGNKILTQLEQQMLSWTGEGDSPDRVDALVHALTELFTPQLGKHLGSSMRRGTGLRRPGGRLSR